MWNLYRSLKLVILFILLVVIMQNMYAASVNFFVEPLYWQASEHVDWAYVNDRATPNTHDAYKTISFDYAPGIRLGFGIDANVDNEFYYTHFDTSTKDSVNGGYIVSAFTGSTAVKPYDGYAYNAGQVQYDIKYDMFEWDLGKRFNVNKVIMLKPIVGLAAGTIKQDIDSSFQGDPLSVTENLTNDFIGVGPKVGIDTELTLLNSDKTQFKFIADFTSYYLWGHWDISDKLNGNTSNTVYVNIDDREMGSLGLQAMMGFKLQHNQFSASLGYEINDWLNQVQFFDDATGAHDNNLVLQGLELKLAYTIA